VNLFLQQGRFLRRGFPTQHVHNLGADIKPHRISQLYWSHGHAKCLGRLIQYFNGNAPFKVHVHCPCHVGCKNPVDQESRRAFNRQGKAIDCATECRTLGKLFRVRFFIIDDLDQGHLGNRIEEMDANQALRFFQYRCDISQRYGGGIGCHHCTVFHLWLDAGKQLTFCIDIFKYGFNDDIGLADAFALNIGNQSTDRTCDLVGCFELLPEK